MNIKEQNMKEFRDAQQRASHMNAERPRGCTCQYRATMNDADSQFCVIEIVQDTDPRCKHHGGWGY